MLELRQVSKVFGHVQALDRVDFQLGAHEVVALVGDNGAGKSTLIKVLSGVYQASSGTVFVDGEPVSFATPADAVAHGISTVYQDLALVDGRSVAANLFLGREFVKGPFIDTKRIVREAKRVIRELKADIPSVTVPVVMLSGGQRQAVAIGRAVAQGGRVIVMDEPTASLGVAETTACSSSWPSSRRRGSRCSSSATTCSTSGTLPTASSCSTGDAVVGDSPRQETSVEQMVKRILFGSLGDVIDDVVLDHITPLRAEREHEQA